VANPNKSVEKDDTEDDGTTSDNLPTEFQNDSPAILETIKHDPNNFLQEKMKLSVQDINEIENEVVPNMKVKETESISSNSQLSDENDDDMYDDFFDSDFYDFKEEPEVSVESVVDMPLCSDLSDIEAEIGLECLTEERTRDEVLEKILEQSWDMLDISATLQPLIGDKLDPLNISRAIPGGEVSVSQEGTVYQANLTMRDIVMYNLSKAHLKKISVTRSENLTNLEVTAWIGIDLVKANGTYSLQGMLGWWPVDSDGVRPFNAQMYNATLVPKVRVDTRAGCDERGNAIITDLRIPLEYDEVNFHMENLGEFYNSVVNGIGVFLISSQAELAVTALQGLIAKNIASFTC